jgi:EpsI family protein
MHGTDTSSLLHKRFLYAVTLVLLVQAALFYSASRSEKIRPISPLQYFPMDVPGWKTIRDMPIEPEVQEVLRADDTLNRLYVNATSSAQAYLFVAYFRSQRAGQTPHSPKNCLPGSGWEALTTGYVTVPVAGEPQPVTINRYVVERGNEKSVVLYWYQSHQRVIANEFAAKFWLVADSIRYHRSDTSLVRVVVPISENDRAKAMRTGVSFVQSMYPLLRQYMRM